MKVSCCCFQTEIRRAVTFITIFHYWSVVSSIVPFIITLEPLVHLIIAVTLTVNLCSDSDSDFIHRCTYYVYISAIIVLIVPILITNFVVIGTSGWNCEECIKEPKVFHLLASIYIIRISIWLWCICIICKYKEEGEKRILPQIYLDQDSFEEPPALK